MKRTEMINKIAVSLRNYECGGHDYSDLELELLLGAYVELAEIALNVCEEEGMMPPFVRKFMHSGNIDEPHMHYKWEN